MSALARLRLGFLALGVLLLLPLFLLLREAEARFESQRRLRHEIVAERIFDEMERELTTLLEFERGRPSSAYESQHTHSSSWSPFVVGYFRYDGEQLVLPAEGQLSAARGARVRSAVAHLRDQGALAALMGSPSAELDAEAVPLTTDKGTQDGAEPTRAVKQEADQKSVLRQLNRALTERSKQKRRAKVKRDSFSKPQPKKRSDAHDDPLTGLDGLW